MFFEVERFLLNFTREISVLANCFVLIVIDKTTLALRMLFNGPRNTIEER